MYVFYVANNEGSLHLVPWTGDGLEVSENRLQTIRCCHIGSLNVLLVMVLLNAMHGVS